ncbi:MAG: carbon-nitrogen hydrolase family protein [Ignavibacteria bacterium]|nr:carbon-nitrogen hydrolase family protein [Ignavibacteria bacterium]MBT8381204.1 carbon-nitrogen hydrolase family protein [Ignavibacteria bacterium]MBT8392772.1 carbon-nitrogen hydrolase family protein [Ignavibacteria bacterium]NNJ54333.1 carbon-nitrogen hydrolase family protein [Ignavibacteriaceae bacterium]NNL22033.1 carbon-nitrogen hydrolase family protein [Ignavibacteriaceae bacterium]
MKIALVQQSAEADKKKNISMAVDAVKEAANNGAMIICFAELAFTKFFPQKPSTGNNLELAERIPGPTTEIFCKLAKDLNVVIILNLYEKDNNKTYDSSPVINSDGKILGVTRMAHITDYSCFHEKSYYTPGNNGAPVYQTKLGKIGVAICYDRHYPEYMRALAIRGAEIVFVPQAGAAGEWPEGLYEAELRVSAFQNGYFTALCNRVGKEECLTFAGESFVCNPAGSVIAKAKTDVEEILYCEVNLQEVKSSHAKKLFLKDRRPELYKEWLKEE